MLAGLDGIYFRAGPSALFGRKRMLFIVETTPPPPPSSIPILISLFVCGSGLRKAQKISYSGNKISLSLNCVRSFRISTAWIRRLVASVSPTVPGFDPRPVLMVFGMEKVTLWQVLSRVLFAVPCYYFTNILHR